LGRRVNATGGANFSPGGILDFLSGFFVEISVSKVSRACKALFAGVGFLGRNGSGCFFVSEFWVFFGGL